MSFPVTITIANPPEGTCPTTFDEAVTIFRSLISGEITSSYIPYVIGSQTPAVEDQDKAWIRLDAAGRPLGTFTFYAGSWRRQYNGKFNEVTMFNGNPTLFFDGTGRGLTTSEWDGWSLCNGQNGTPNLTDKFIVAAHMDDSDGSTGFSGGWRTKVSGAIVATGGAKEVTLTNAQAPVAAIPMVVVDTFDAGAIRDNSGKVYGTHSSGTGDPGDPGTVILVEEVTAEDGSAPVPTLPPYYALAYCVFSGYS